MTFSIHRVRNSRITTSLFFFLVRVLSSLCLHACVCVCVNPAPSCQIPKNVVLSRFKLILKSAHVSTCASTSTYDTQARLSPVRGFWHLLARGTSVKHGKIAVSTTVFNGLFPSA